MNNLGRVIKGAVTALGCLIFAMMFFAGVIALSDYSVAQSHNQPGAAEGATLAEVITLLAFVGGSALLVWIVRGRFKRATITGPLVVRSDDGCLYVRAPFAGDTDLYWLRHLPAGYTATSSAIEGPGGALFGNGQTITVSGAVSGGSGDTVCVSVHILDATAIR